MTAPVRHPSPEHSFKVGDQVAVDDPIGLRVGKVVGLADDEPMLLVRWKGSRVCDWKQAKELIHVDESGVPSRQKEKVER